MEPRVDEIAQTAVEEVAANDVVQGRLGRQLRERDLQFIRQPEREPGVEILVLLAKGDDRFADDGNDSSFFDEDDQVFPEIGVER
jgi:hypothetical protein